MTDNKWEVYEQRKAVLQKKTLTPEEYQEAIKRLSDELEI